MGSPWSIQSIHHLQRKEAEWQREDQWRTHHEADAGPSLIHRAVVRSRHAIARPMRSLGGSLARLSRDRVSRPEATSPIQEPE